MKKIVTLFVFCAFVSLANAKVGYLLRTSTVEGLSTGEQYNERAAAEWFNDNYVETGKGDFIAMNAIPTNTDTYTAIWINIDDNGSGALPSEFTADVITNIGKFVKAGGNLLLTKRAARVLCEIGRMKKNDNLQYEPSEEWRDACRQFVNAKIAPNIQLRDASHHPIFQDVPVYNSEEGHFLLSSSVSDPDKGYIWTEMYRKDGGKSDNGNIANLNDFQSNWSCQVLAVWGSVADYIAPVIVEFYPQGDDYKGTILSIGTASYKWGTANTNIANVKTLTSNALSYLDHNGAEIGYYMPYALSELYSTDENHADFQTAKWFYDNYVVTNKGRFIHKEEDFPSEMKVLWVHNDRKDLSKVDFYNAFGGDAFKTKLQAFLSGGNLYLSKQACYLAYKLEKIYEPDSYGSDGYEEPNGDEWSVNAGNLGYSLDASCHQDRSSHPIYRGLTKGTYRYDNGAQTIPFQTFMLVGRTRRTNNNTMWSEMRRNGSTQGNDEPTKLANFESDWNCKVLGVWGQIQNFCAAGLIEFNPDSRSGKIIANGFAAYQWGTSNTDLTAIGNVHLLTSNILEYLKRENEVKGCSNCFPVY